MTNAILHDKISSPQTRTGQKNDGIRPGRSDESNAEFQSSATTRERPEAEIDRASLLLAQRTADHNVRSSIRDRDRASEIAAHLASAMAKNPAEALGAHAALNSVAVEATLATPPN